MLAAKVKEIIIANNNLIGKNPILLLELTKKKPVKIEAAVARAIKKVDKNNIFLKRNGGQE